MKVTPLKASRVLNVKSNIGNLIQESGLQQHSELHTMRSTLEKYFNLLSVETNNI